MLTLTIKKKWFDMICSGEKKEEYREIKPYYDSRFEAYIPDFCNFKKIEMDMSTAFVPVADEIIFRNGYRKNSPKIKCKVKVRKGYGRADWGAIPNKEYYILEILKVEEVSDNEKNNK